MDIEYIVLGKAKDPIRIPKESQHITRSNDPKYGETTFSWDQKIVTHHFDRF